jgi:hypothetical protein
LFNREGDCLAAKLRPGNVHSAEGWEELLLPEIERQQKRQGKEVVFRADAAFAKPESRRCRRQREWRPGGPEQVSVKGWGGRGVYEIEWKNGISRVNMTARR